MNNSEDDDSTRAHIRKDMAVESFRVACGEAISVSDVVIVDDPWCIFHAHVIGTRRHRYVLVEDQSKIGGDRYTLKRYESRKIYLEDGTWEHEDILLHPLNPGYPVIRLEPGGTYRICGWFVGTVPELQRVKPPRYESIEEE